MACGIHSIRISPSADFHGWVRIAYCPGVGVYSALIYQFHCVLIILYAIKCAVDLTSGATPLVAGNNRGLFFVTANIGYDLGSVIGKRNYGFVANTKY